MKILKPGKVEMRKFVCEKCGCVFAVERTRMYRDGHKVTTITECPCGVAIKWDKGEPYEEPTHTPTQSDEALLADLIHSSNAVDFDTAIKLSPWLIANGVTFREG